MPGLSVDAAAIEAFVVALFAHATPGNYISLRCFREHGGAWASISPVEVDNDLSGVIKAATEIAEFAAQEKEPTVFCPPVCTFSSRTKATEKDIAEAVAVSVECDQCPIAALGILQRLLGPPTVVVESGGIWTNPETGAAESKLHLHWRLSKPASGADLKPVKEARRMAAQLVGADVSTVPISHPLRWPGGVWRKQEPGRLCRIRSLRHVVH